MALALNRRNPATAEKAQMAPFHAPVACPACGRYQPKCDRRSISPSLPGP